MSVHDPSSPTGRPSRRRRFVASGAAVGIVLAGALLPAQNSEAQPSSGSTAVAAKAPYRNAHLPTARRVADLIGRMTLEEKIGQMAQAERLDIDADPSLITEYELGSVLSGGGSTPAQNTPEAWADMVDDYQAAALK